MAEVQAARSGACRRRRVSAHVTAATAQDAVALIGHDDRGQDAGEHQRVEDEEPVRAAADRSARATCSGTKPASTLPPSSGGTGIMLNTASSTFSDDRETSRTTRRTSARHRGRAAGITMRTAAPPTASIRLLTGPATATIAKSRRGCAEVLHVHRHRLRPADERQRRSTSRSAETAPCRSSRCAPADSASAGPACAPSDRQAGPPSTRAPPRETRATAIRMTNGNDGFERQARMTVARADGHRRTRSPDITVPAKCANARPSAAFGADRGFQFLAAGAPHAGHRSERGQQLLAPARADAGDRRRARSEGRAWCATGDGTSPQSGAPRRGCAAAAAAPPTRAAARCPSTRSRVKISSSSLASADRDEPVEPDLAQRRVGRRQLPLPPSIDDEIRERPALLEHALIAAEHDLVHGGEVIQA